MDKYTKAEIEESRIARAILNNETISPVKLWHAPGIPTVYNAIYLIAPQKGIIPISDTIQPTATPNNQKVFVATVKAKCGDSIRYGAATSSDGSVARLLAYRNAIRQLLNND
jgi:hypothetical protein